jgi:hypothetical protein
MSEKKIEIIGKPTKWVRVTITDAECWWISRTRKSLSGEDVLLVDKFVCVVPEDNAITEALDRMVNPALWFVSRWKQEVEDAGPDDILI